MANVITGPQAARLLRPLPSDPYTLMACMTVWEDPHPLAPISRPENPRLPSRYRPLRAIFYALGWRAWVMHMRLVPPPGVSFEILQHQINVTFGSPPMGPDRTGGKATALWVTLDTCARGVEGATDAARVFLDALGDDFKVRSAAVRVTRWRHAEV